MPWKDPETRKQYRREWYKKNKEKHIQNSIKYARANPEVAARAQRKINYGLTDEVYQELLRKQNYSCAVCSRGFDEVKPCVDHDHITKIVRGLLCNDCNLGLGRFKDSIDILLRAIEYLRRR